MIRNLVAARVGRLSRGLVASGAVQRLTDGVGECGTNRRWPDVRCSRCGQAGATSFDFSSYRRAWFACLTCNEVWLADRQED
jgi:hypothetical protein